MTREFFKKQKYFVSIFTVVILILFLFQLRTFVNSTTISLVFLLAVLFCATIYGSRPAYLVSVICGLAFNFLFLHPFYTLSISEAQNWVAFGAFLLTAVIAGQLSAYAKKRSEESEHRRLEIERLYDELQAAFEQTSEAEALRRSEKLKSALLDAVTHDLRTPLTSIKASVTTLLEDRKEKLLDEEGKVEFLEIIDEETDRLNKFFEGMVSIAKIEANSLTLRKSENNIEEIINNAIKRAKNQLLKHKIEIKMENNLPKVFIDGVSISEVVYTLLDNALKYSPKNTTIRISTTQTLDNFIEIAVEDKGKGIAKHLREKVFSKFYRRDNDDIHTTSSGLGLGLAIAKGIVESQGGNIWIEDGTDGFKTKVAFTVQISKDIEAARSLK